TDLQTYCARHSTWDMESLNQALLREGEPIYARMLEPHLAEIRLREHWAQVAARMERGRAEEPTGALNRLARLMGFGRRSLLFESDAGKAAKRGIHLLEENLNPAQRQQYTKYRYFDVIGGKSGKRYRIHHGCSMNIDQLDKNGK